jgi:ketosteroid isomerase-like protein
MSEARRISPTSCGKVNFMRFAAVLMLAASAFAAGPEDLVKQAAEGWTAAAVKQDVGGLKRFMAEDLQYAHAGGQTQNREQYIAAVMKGPPRYESFTFSDVKVVLYGKAAVLTGFVDVKMAGQDAFRVRTLQVYTENGGQWQMSAHQSTRLGR